MATERLERRSDEASVLGEAMEAWQAGIHTAMPGIVLDFDPAARTVSVQPAIRGRIARPNGSVASVPLPVLVDVPVYFPRGGGYSMTFPVRPGDECLVIFAERCIDGWWQSGGVQEPAEYRLHDIADGFALIGPYSQAAPLAGGVSMAGPEIRTDSGEARVRLEGNEVVIVAPDGISIDTPAVTVTGDVIASGISLVNHVHVGCQGGTTGAPI